MEVEIDGVAMPRLRSRKGLLLLALLILRHDTEIARDWLCGILWIDSTEENARLSLRQTLHDLRQALGSQAYRLESPTTRTLRFLAEGAEVDVLQFDQILRQAEPTPEHVEKALSLYRGTLLEDWREEILLNEQENRRLTYLGALERTAERLQEQGNHKSAVHLLREGVVIAPLHESLYRGLMTSLAQDNRFAECMEVYRTLRLRLWEEVNMQPHPETVHLYNRLRANFQEQAQQNQTLRPAIAMEEKSPPSTTRPALNLVPKPLTLLIGREQEMREIEALLEDHALVTLSGMGGVGKTRLVLEIAQRVVQKAQFPDGVVFVSLSGLQTPELLPSFLTRALQIPEQATGVPLDTLCEFLRPKALLLVLDNCEHIVQACAELVFHLLTFAPEVKVLATSREVLALGGEHIYPVRPLPLPSAEAVVQESPAIRLFVERARQVSPHFSLEEVDTTLLVNLMHLLEGIPLALELAAARLKVLSLQQISERMADRFRLLRTTERAGMRQPMAMEDSVRASYQLLTPEVAQVFRVLSLFSGGFQLEMAEDVGEGLDVLEALTRLVESSLVVLTTAKNGEARYSMLETIRQFGLARLREAGEYDQFAKRHFSACLRFVQEAREQITGSESTLWMERMEAEQPNWTTALLNAPTDHDFLTLVNMLLRYWFTVGHYHEGRRWFDLALERLEGAEPSLCSRIYNGAGIFAWHQARFQVGLEYLEKSVALARAVEDTEALANALNNMQLITRALSDYERAYQAGLEALECYRKMGSAWGMARTCSNLGQTADVLKLRAEAKQFYQEGMKYCEEVGDRRGIAYILVSLAETEIEDQTYSAARPLLEQGIRIFDELSDVFQLAWCMDVLVPYAIGLGDAAKATYMHVLCFELRNRLGSDRATASERPHLIHLETLTNLVGHDFYEEIVKECKRWSVEQARDFALEVCALTPLPEE
jgi:predicted ATPase/DNA-binding SARP family transcriptional activator